MTKKQQVKKDTPKAVELNKAALDQAAGGAGGCGINVAVGDVTGDGLLVRTITGGTTKPRT